MYADIKHISENQFRPDQVLVYDYSFFPSSCFALTRVINHLETQIIGTSLYSNNDILGAEKRRKILIVDDEHDITNLYKLCLERDGFVVDTFNDPLLALSSYKAGAYDLLLLDVKMPRMNGFELYQEILSRHLDDNVKVCFITAFEEYYTEFRKLFPNSKEAECFIRKPVELKELTKKVKSQLQ